MIKAEVENLKSPDNAGKLGEENAKVVWKRCPKDVEETEHDAIRKLTVRVPGAIHDSLGSLHGKEEGSGKVLDSGITITVSLVALNIFIVRDVEEVEESTKRDESDDIDEGKYENKAEPLHL